MTQFRLKSISLIAAAAVMTVAAVSVRPQTTPDPTPTPAPTATQGVPAVTTTRYLDQADGMTADEAVLAALNNNGELIALRQERDAARAMVKQAGLRANPSVDIGGTRQVKGMDNSLMVEGMLPLELGGRRAARIRVAERELEIREKAVEERERMLAADVRMKFGESLAAVSKLGFADEILTAIFEEYRLVQARVAEGKIAPLEENMTLVEVNRLRSIREGEAGKAEIAMLELRNLLGLRPEEPLRLRGDLENLIAALPPVSEMTARALQTRPDLAAMRAMEELSTAKIDQAKADGRIDASVRGGYQRMRSGFGLNGLNDAGELMPIENLMHFFTFGVTLELPVRNRNQGMIEAAAADREAARSRREFGELVVRREIAAGAARFESSAKAMVIFKFGVRDQANANLDVIRQTYELGSRSLIDYLIEQRRYIEIENEYIDLQMATYLARVEVMRAANAAELVKK